MADFYKYSTETGLIIPDTSEVKTDVENEYISAFGAGLSLQEDTPQGRLIELETIERTRTINTMAAIANQINIDYATGQYLDAIGAFYGIERIGATRTRTLATLTGDPGTVIPAGSKAKTTLGNVFYSENAVTIGSGGTITVYFLAEEKGAIPCLTGELNEIVDQIVGWSGIYNPANAVLGIENEGDYNYRIRIKNSRYSGIGLVESIGGAINKVEGVRSSFVKDNGTNLSESYDNITIDPHSIVVIVDGGDNEELAYAIFRKKSGGCAYTAISGQSETIQVHDGIYEVLYTVTFNRPEELQADIAITVNRNNYNGSDLEQAVKNAIETWANCELDNIEGLKIGQNMSPFEIAAAVSDQIPEIYVKNVLICDHGGTPATTELTCHISQVYRVAEANITVTIIN